MRTGEVCALTWDDIDFENRVINIKHNVYCKTKDDKGRWYIGTPKTIDSERQVYINDTLLAALKNYKTKREYLKKQYGNKYHYYHLEDIKNKFGKVVEYRIVKIKRKSKLFKSLELLFTKKDGKYVGTDIIRYPFKIIHNELNIKNCRFYDLRGSYATGSLRQGVEIKDIADALGHSKIETTEDYYISSTEKTRKIANEIFEEVIQSDIIDRIINYKY